MKRLYEQVADQIAVMIRDKGYSVGSRLPPERDLARVFEVSRPTIREALIALEIGGLLEVRTGAGAFVRDQISHRDPAAAADAGPSAFDVVAARRLIEPGVAALAATSATPEDIANITEAMSLFEQAWHGNHWEKLEADRRYHMALAEACHNPLLLEIVEDLWKAMFGPIFAILSERTKLTKRRSATMHDHRTILSCIVHRDVSGAEAAMKTHLIHVELTLKETAVDETGKSRAVRRPGRRHRG